MGVREEIGSNRAAFARGLVEIARYREKTLSPEEPAIGDLRQPARAQRVRELSAHLLHRIGMIDRHVALATTGFVVAGKHRDAFEQRRFADAVLAHDDGDRLVETEFEVV